MIIGLGHQKRVGKDTVADILVNEYGYTKISFISALRELCEIVIANMMGRLTLTVYERKVYKWARRYGLRHDSVVFEILVNSNFPDECYMVEGGKHRNLYKYIGTTLIRDNISEDFWLNITKKQVARHPKCVLSDVRYKNEFDFVKKNGLAIKIHNPLIDHTDTHESETCLKRVKWHAVLETGVTIKDKNDPADTGLLILKERLENLSITIS